MDIKKLRPQKHSRYKQGYINPSSCKKLFENQKNKPIIYRSSYERRFVEWLETSKHVERWGSECVQIPYMNKYDNTQHVYYPDYIAVVDGETIIFEIKPYNQCVAPDDNMPKDSYVWKTYITNMSKWAAAKQYCEAHNMKFKILTEKTINILK